MTKDVQPGLDPQKFVDQLYDIALDPGALDTFIGAWNNAGLDARSARQTIESIDSFDAAFSSHLKRAETFLLRGEIDGPSLTELLAPFENLAAMIVDRSMRVVACNAGATHSFGLSEGDPLAVMQSSGSAQGGLEEAMQELFRSVEKPDRLLRLEMGPSAHQTLIQLRRLSETGDDGLPLALVVTTQYHWQPVLGQTLEEVFHLTLAEQSVVRALVEGRDAKSIAEKRGTSEGTVRGQIKSILAKMNARSQSEIIRLVLSLRDVILGANSDQTAPKSGNMLVAADWLEAEVWKPFKTLTLPDGRRLDYHDMGPVTGAPVLYSHMGYCLARWSRPMVKLAFEHGLRIICPIRAGYGQSANLAPGADVMKATRDDTVCLLEHLGIARLPYLTQGNDLIFAVDLAAKRPDVVSEIIGLCARPCLPGDRHYAGMGQWHRFFLSTAKHAPHLLNFTAKAAVALARRIGVDELFRQMNKRSPADMALVHDAVARPVLIANAELIASKTANVAQAYTMEILQTESDWSEIIVAARETPIRFVNGIEDPSLDMATIAEYREKYPWIEIEVVSEAGQLLIFQHFDYVIPSVAAAAKSAINTS